MIKIVIFAEKGDTPSADEKWRRFQCFLPDEKYKPLKEIILQLDKNYWKKIVKGGS